MWLLCGILSVILCIAGWIMASKKETLAQWACFCSLAFVAITLLMEYRMVLNWVNKADWSALLDVVPSTFSTLSGYVVIMLLTNALLIITARHKNKNPVFTQSRRRAEINSLPPTLFFSMFLPMQNSHI